MLKDKVVFITGAASGIGYGMAEACAEQGAAVVISDIDGEKAKESSNLLLAKGYACVGVKCDVSVESEMKSALNRAYQQFGRIDVLVNNAGLQYIAMIEDFPTEKFEQMLRLMVTAPFTAIKHVLPQMKKQRYGRIINIGSINGLIGFAGKSAYNSAKHGLIGLTKAAALETAAFGITVNALCPGYVDTLLVRNQLKDLAINRGVSLESVLTEIIYPMVPQHRLLSIHEVVDYAIFLASDKGKGITGQAVIIDGGYTAQ